MSVQFDLKRLPHDVTQPLTHVQCCICFEYVLVDLLFVDAGGQKWDLCRECGEEQR